MGNYLQFTITLIALKIEIILKLYDILYIWKYISYKSSPHKKSIIFKCFTPSFEKSWFSVVISIESYLSGILNKGVISRFSVFSLVNL